MIFFDYTSSATNTIIENIVEETLHTWEQVKKKYTT